MKDEIAQRQDRARNLMADRGFGALVLATAQNIQYFTNVTEPSIHICGVVIITQQPQPALAVLWIDQHAAQEQAEDASVETYTPTTQGKVVTEILERLGGTKSPIAVDGRALTVVGNSLKQSLPKVELVNATIAIEEELRSVKSDEEVKLIRKACEIAGEGMRTAAESLRPGLTELEVASLAEQRMIALGSDGIKHTTSVASGPRAKLTHSLATQKKIAAGEVVTIDLGAVFQGYCSDLARTFVIGKVDEELKKAFNVWRSAQDEVIQKLRPGEAIEEVQALPREFTKAAGYSMVGHMGHNLGLGIEEHPFLMGVAVPDPEARIEKNNVLAFFQGSIKREGIINLGIRLEDTVLVTDKGAEMLTSYPRELFSV